MPITSDMLNTNTTKDDFYFSSDMVFSEKQKTISFSTFEWNNQYMNNFEDGIDLLGSTCAQSPPRNQPHIFRFPSVTQNEEDFTEKRFMKSPSRISDVIGTKMENDYF